QDAGPFGTGVAHGSPERPGRPRRWRNLPRSAPRDRGFCRVRGGRHRGCGRGIARMVFSQHASSVPHRSGLRAPAGSVTSVHSQSIDFISSLNPAQQEAVLHTEGPLLILAGAGSGKTRVITTRIAHLIATGKAAPGQVLAVTFTNKAAEEMRHRVKQLLGGDCRQVWLSTFHSLCARILRREAPALGLSRDFVIYDSSDQMAVVKQAMKAHGIDDKLIQPRAALSRISQAKNRMETPATMKSSGWSVRDQQIGTIYEAYSRSLADAGALDFDDLLLRTVEVVESNEHVRLAYAGKFKYILVDEYQDTTRPQYILITRLAEVDRNLCVVGDPDQSIYKWRGADLRNILDFERDFPDAHVVKLEQNYRSTQ